ncbi:MAG: alginate lyase family protein [Planctomycetia bacterium]|nr:alginate lyase family protein [Planctomycetia bacterium]
MNRLARLYWIVRGVGWENVPRRAWHIAKGRLGLDSRRRLVRRLAAGCLAEQFVADYRPEDALTHWRGRAERFFVGPRQMAGLRTALAQVADAELWQRHVGEQVALLPQGKMRFFNHAVSDTGWPVDFNRDPLSGISWPTGLSWRSYRQFDPKYADLKCVWEASRFSVAWALARDYVRDASSPGERLFWQLLSDWDRQNPFGRTAQWVCGQEATFRLMAWLFAACAFLDAPDAQAARYHRLTELACLTGLLVEDNIPYARSQKNNHAVSEAMCLWTLGLLFPELRRAEAWRAKGRRILVADLRRQIYPDGSYVQHSMNYHRVMLDDALWAVRLGALAGDPLPEVHEPLLRAVEWLTAMIDPKTGRAPNYGANDGALVLPLACCDFTDYRPVAQAANYLLKGSRLFPAGPWDEEMLWLCGPEPLAARVQGGGRPAHFSAPVGGYYTTSGPRSWAFTRVHAYRDRPHQADMLHVDLWYDGVNVLADGGSFHYYAQPPWQHFFESTAAHNTVEIDGRDQMDRGPSFLWFHWTQAKLLAFETSADGRASFLAGEHYGYLRLSGRLVHRRSIARILDAYVIIDDILGAGSHDVALRWRLHPAGWQEQQGAWHARAGDQAIALRVIAPPAFATRHHGGQAEPQPEGWQSRYYAEREAVPTLVTRGWAEAPLRLVTVVGPAEAGIECAAAGDAAGAPLAITGIADRALAAEIERLSSRKIAAR